MGQVRAVLWQHLAAHAPAPAPPDADPNALLPAADFSAALQEVALHGGDHALEEAGRSYARLWARTFRTLVRHMRGHPGHAMQLWTTDVYPYLRGDRLAARTTPTGRQRYEVLTQGDLPDAYVVGLIAGFVGLSHADVEVQTTHTGRFEVRTHLRPAERASRLAYQAAQLRIPLLLTSLLAALVGTSLGALAVGALPAWDVLAVLAGTLAAQSGANAFHDIFGGRRYPLSEPGASRGWLRFQLFGSYAVAAAALTWLVLQGRPGLIVYGAVGLGLGILYRSLRDQGYGPIIAAVTHGPLTVWGSAHAFIGPELFATPGPALLFALPTGLMAAAILFLDDLADRPIDEAAGRRTLVVRMPRRRHVAAFAALVIGAAVAASLIFLLVGRMWWLGVPLLVAAAMVSRQVRAHLDDPHSLAPARAAVLGLYLATGASVIAAIIGVP